MNIVDTIAAIATAPSDAGIGIVRLSGGEAVAIADEIIVDASGGHSLKSRQPNTIRYGHVVGTDGAVIDEVLVSYMRAPHSYTGEDVIEINCHGGHLVITRVLEECLRHGARIAGPGEFTKRAFLNGRIDLTEAEAVMDLISAKNTFAADNSLRQLKGSLKNEITSLRQVILHETARIEAALDDPDAYDLTGISAVLKENMLSVRKRISHLLDTSEEGILRKDGIRCVILGKPNVGKSSLLNLLSGEERAIVTSVPGTTRDVLTETVSFGPFLLHIYDTAGIRDTDEVVEKIGVERAKKVSGEADVIFFVLDIQSLPDEEDALILSDIRDKDVFVFLNKSDLCTEDEIAAARERICSYLAEKGHSFPVIVTSFLEDSDAELLKETLSSYFLKEGITPKEEYYLTNQRHKDELIRTLDSIDALLCSIDSGMSEDLYTIDLNEAYHSLSSILGEEVGEDLIDEIFSGFCMGK